MKFFLKIIAFVSSVVSAFLLLLYIWTDIISEHMLAKLLITFVVVFGLSVVLYLITMMGGDEKLKKDGFLRD